MSAVTTKRIYSDPEPSDGYRVLVDRLWPRGISKERAHLDLWLKDVAPSPTLRTWWNHDPDRMKEFEGRYVSELEDNEAVEQLLDIVKEQSVVTLVYAAKDPHVNHAEVLRRYLESLNQ